LTERFADLHLKNAPLLTGEVPGPKSRELLMAQEKLEGSARSYSRAVPLAWKDASGATMRDVDGNIFIDFFGGAGTVNVGHSNPYVLEASILQQRELIQSLDFPTLTKIKFMNQIRGILPGTLRNSAKIQFGGPTGSDAVESAIKLSVINTGRSSVIAFQGSYHGMTAGALSVTSNKALKYFGASTKVNFMPFPYCYRCPFGLKPNGCNLACAKYVENALDDPHSGVEPPAAFIIEPIQGEGGTIVPPEGYVQEIARICRKHNSVLIFDEIQTGFFRTGKFFACQYPGVTPDIITLSKGLGGIGYPISCIAYDESLDKWNPGAHIGTFRGNQAAMAAGMAAIDFLLSHDFESHVQSLGEAMMQKLRLNLHECELVGDIRGKGMMFGIEIVKSQETKEPSASLANELRAQCYKRGLIVEIGGHYSNVVRFLPPLVITRDLALKGIDIFLEAMGSVCSM
jgi:diaminobutyrate-2-oxoglutarate transaminase